MSKRSLGIFLSLCAATFGMTASGAEPSRQQQTVAPERSRDRPPEREWFVIEEHGRRRERGVVHRRTLPATRSEPARIELTEEREGRREREGLLFETRIRTQTLTDTLGRALRRETLETAGDRRTTTTVAVDARRSEVRLDRNPAAAGQRGRQRFSASPDTRFGLEPEVLVVMAGGAERLIPGARFQSPVLDLAGARVVVEEIELVAAGPAARLAPPLPDAFAPDFLPPDTPLIDAVSRAEGRDPVRLVFTPGGRLLWMGGADGAVVWRATDQAEYERESAPVEIVTTLLHGGRLPAWQAYDRLDFELFPLDVWQAALPPVAFDAPRAVWQPLPDNRLHLTLYAAAPRETPPPMASKWREPLDHPTILRAAKEADAFRPLSDTPKTPGGNPATPGEARARLRRLVDWVGREIRSRQQAVIVLDPVETLRQKKGHCGEHARLLAALCRALGMPARLCQGLTTRETGLVYHAWVEVWTGDGWTPADSTTGLVDFRAGYWTTAREDPDGTMTDPLAGALQRGGLHVRWLGAAVADPDGRWHGWRSGDPPPLARRGEGAFDFAMGVGLWSPPEGWRFAGRGDEADGGGLLWEAPDGGMALRLQAWPGMTFRVDDFAWRRRSGELQGKLPRYRLASGTTRSWPPEDATSPPVDPRAIRRPALLMDYRWHGERGPRWARQWEVALPDRHARATVTGDGDSRFHDPVTQALFAASRLY